MKEDSMTKERRLYSIDALKFCAACIVFAYHCNLHLGIQFGFLTDFISQGAVLMDLFFMLSGFAMYHSYCEKELTWDSGVKQFYYKRILSVYPLYLLVVIVYLTYSTYPIGQRLIALPAELLLLQAWFNGFFLYFHNGGTWFVSCLMFCYFLFPWLKEIINRTSRRCRVVCLGILYLLCAVFPFMVFALGLPDIYSNPMLRILQFGSGMILARTVHNSQSKYRGGQAAGLSVIAFGSVLLLVISISRMSQLFYRNNYLLYGWITFPLLLVLIWSVVSVEKTKSNPIPCRGVKVLGDLSYPIYLAQFFIWSPVREIVAKRPDMFELYWNLKVMALAAALCALLTALFVYVFDRPIKIIITSVFRYRTEYFLKCEKGDKEKTIL